MITVLRSDWLQVVETLYWLVVSWAPVPCVHTYHLSYRSPADMQAMFDVVSDIKTLS